MLDDSNHRGGGGQGQKVDTLMMRCQQAARTGQGQRRFVKPLADVEGALLALYAAAAAGELDESVESMTATRMVKGFESNRNVDKAVAGSWKTFQISHNAMKNITLLKILIAET